MHVRVSLTAFAVYVSVELSLEEPLFDHRSRFVMRDVLEGVCFGSQRCVICCIFIHQHGALQFLLITVTCKYRFLREIM